MNYWKERIVEMLMVKSKLDEVDEEPLWDYYLPELPAKPEEIARAQKEHNLKLSQEYIDFLLLANGWKAFCGDTDLFGTKDFSSDAMERARRQLRVEAESNREVFEMQEHLLPIAASEEDKEVFVLVMAEGEKFGQVIWLSGEEIDRFASFSEFFESMIAYNRLFLEWAIAEKNNQTHPYQPQ